MLLGQASFEQRPARRVVEPWLHRQLAELVLGGGRSSLPDHFLMREAVVGGSSEALVPGGLVTGGVRWGRRMKTRGLSHFAQLGMGRVGLSILPFQGEGRARGVDHGRSRDLHAMLHQLCRRRLLPQLLTA